MHAETPTTDAPASQAAPTEIHKIEGIHKGEARPRTVRDDLAAGLSVFIVCLVFFTVLAIAMFAALSTVAGILL